MDGLALELELPRYLYTENRDENGVVTGITYATEKLVTWAGHGCGDEVGKLCDRIYKSEVEKITAQQEHQLLLLEEQWLKLENGEDDDAEEAQYDLACEALINEAQAARLAARQRMEQRHAAIDQLVLESMEHLANNSPAQEEPNVVGYLFALALLAGVIYVMLS